MRGLGAASVWAWPVLAALCACARGPAAPSPSPRQQTASKQDIEAEWRQYQAELARVRDQLMPGIEAFRSKDQERLRAWSTDPMHGAALRTFGAGLLVQLGAPGSDRLFVESFAASGPELFWLFEEFQEALLDDHDVSKDPHLMLICAALRGWDGAIEKLIAVREHTDGSVHQDNCCGLAFYAASHPDDAVRRYAAAGLQEDIVHAFEEESSPATAKQLLAALAAKTFAVPEEEQFRRALVPVLEAKAQQTDPKVCGWMNCEKLGGLLGTVDAQPPHSTPNIAGNPETYVARIEPLDDPTAARRYGYAPGTILRFSKSVRLPPSTPPWARRHKEQPSQLSLLVFRQCADDGSSCRDEIALHPPDGRLSELLIIKPFTEDRGLVEHVGQVRNLERTFYDLGVFELALVKGTERSVLCVWPTPPYPTKRLEHTTDAVGQCPKSAE